MSKAHLIETVAVIGAGAMGAGIAQVAAIAGHDVLLFDARANAAAAGVTAIAAALEARVKRGAMTAVDATFASGRIVAVDSLSDLAGASLVIEAIVEDADIKRRLFADLEAVLAPDAIMATNTSSLSISQLASGLAHPARVAGFHFFNPAPVMKLVELVSGLATDPQVIDCLETLSRAWGKIPVRVRSTPGFIVNRVARPFYGEAWRLLEQRAGDPATIDAVLRESGGFKMGPFELMDMIGHDVNFAVTRSVFDAYFGDPRYRPAIAQAELVAAGWLGRKSRRGVYDYADGATTALPAWIPEGPLPDAIEIQGSLGPAETLVPLFEAAGIRISRTSGADVIRIGETCILLADGRTASERAREIGSANCIQFDLAGDYATCTAIALAAADHADETAITTCAGLFQAIGKRVARIDDVPGMVVLRTVAMIANEAAEVVQQGIASAADVDIAMLKGVNYPIGPVAWIAAIGASRITRALDHLQQYSGDDHYRVSAFLRRLAATDTP